MENASLAVRMAGGVLIALLIVSFFVAIMVVINDNQQKQQDEEDLRQVALFNESYSSFENRIITGYQMLSLINKAIDYNKRMTKEQSNGGEDFTPIHIYGEVIGTDNGGSEMLPGQKNKINNRNSNKNGYIDMNAYYTQYFTKAEDDDKKAFKDMYFKWESTKYVEPDAKDAEGKRLGDVDGVGRVYEMYFREYVK